MIGVAGESGSGKSVTATALVAALDAAGVRTAIIHQDDYFLRPPRTNRGSTNCPALNRVSATSRRNAADCRKRRGRHAGN